MLLKQDKHVIDKPMIHSTVGEVFRFLFRVSSSMLILTDGDGYVVMVNHEALMRLGYTEDAMVGRHVDTFVRKGDAGALAEKIRDSHSGVQVFDTIPFISREKKNIDVESRLSMERIDGRDYYLLSSDDLSVLKSTEEKFLKAFHSSSVIMVVFSVAEGCIIDVNESASRLTGYTSRELIGKTIRELDLYPDKNQRKDIYARIMDSGQICDFELAIRTKQGETRHVLFSMDTIIISDELCVLAAGSDFSQQKKSEGELRKAYAELDRQKKIIEKKNLELEKAKAAIEKESRLVEEASRHKTEFLASMSHELRTPLNSIILLSDLLKRNSDGNLTKKDVEFVSIIKSAGMDLLALINDVLDISRVESGRMDVDLSSVSLEYFTRKLSGYFTEMAAVKGLGFSIRSEKGLTDSIVTDIQKLEQIVKNLISNAIKFTGKGFVELWIHRPGNSGQKSGMACDNTIAFTVKDTGIGIPEDKLEEVFDLYSQADKSILRKYGGTGLGLPVSRVMARLLGGDIRVESEYGRGSTFTFYHPEKQLSATGHGKRDAIVALNSEATDVFHADVEQALAGRTILIADDDMRTNYALMQSLEPYNPNIFVVSDGEKCLQKLTEHPETELLLLDITMPEKDGFDVLQTIQRTESLKHIRVIVISAKAMDEDRAVCMDQGANAFFPKPIDVDGLLCTMAELLRN